MNNDKVVKVALIGNPNTGKTSLFNQLTGLKQKVGNYPGITVEKKQGFCKLNDTVKAEIIDLPGTYSINPTSLDETLVLDTLLNENNDTFPDVIVVVVDIENIKRNLLLFTQLKDLKIPTILVINMIDQMKRKGININVPVLAQKLNAKVVLASARKNLGVEELKSVILKYKELDTTPVSNISVKIDEGYFANLKKAFPEFPLYKSWLLITQNQEFDFLTENQKKLVAKFRKDIECIKRYQHKETIFRYKVINDILKDSFDVDKSKATDLRGILDRILIHKIFGYIIFTLILLFIFQGIFNWASYPMDVIDGAFANLSSWTKVVMPPGTFTNLIAEGIIPGIGGIIIFIPQIAILFTFISILEETGYMSRVVFLMDKIMRRFGMSGKSIIPLISGTACAIPAIMASRNISSWKERLITILVVPVTTCSARLPVYAILIALIIPNQRVFGILNLQGLTMMAMYLIGFAAAIASSMLLHNVLKVKSKSFFVIEMPNYKVPSIKNIFYEVVEKTKAFIFGAGKIILALSIVLWFLASNGPSTFKNAEKTIKAQTENTAISQQEFQKQVASYKLEHSYIGYMGKTIEPVIEPMGYDWKIGIALISSFAAREVFVGALATIYNVESDDDNNSTIKERMTAEVNPKTGESRFNFPTGISLLLFYAFAMQCVGTLAIVKRETNSWKWPILQVVGMGILAYISAAAAYLIFS